ncbi:MAG: RHS repeat domain-containing protein, partial [Pseudomonadota bacterium]
MNRIQQCVAGFCALISAGAASIAYAQTPPEPLQVNNNVDGFGVDLVSGIVSRGDLANISIGPGEPQGLSFSKFFSGSGWRNSTLGTIFDPNLLGLNPINPIVSFGGSAEQFVFVQVVGNTYEYEPEIPSGASLILDVNTFEWLYTSADGTKYVYAFELGAVLGPEYGLVSGILKSVTLPTGQIISYHYIETGTGNDRTTRIFAVTTNTGYHMRLEYEFNGTPTNETQRSDWRTLTKVVLFDPTIETSCNIFMATCSTYTKTWPSLIFTGTEHKVTSVKDAENHTTYFTHNGSGQLTSIQLPGDSSPYITYTYNVSTGRVSSVQTLGQTWAFSRSDSGNNRTTTITNPEGKNRVVTSDLNRFVVLRDKNELNQETVYQYDANHRLHKVTAPEGDYVQYGYDARGNVTTTTVREKPAAGSATITTTIVYPGTCTATNKFYCNKPYSITDGRGNNQIFHYSATHGGVTKIYSEPVGIQRQITELTYTAIASYGYGGPGQNIYYLTKTETCATTQYCPNSANQLRTTITYGGAHWLPISTTVGNGAGGIQSTTSLTYDHVGNVVTANGPLTNDETYFFFDDLRRPIGSIGPDPAGPRPRPAQKFWYNSRGQQYRTDVGTATGVNETHLHGLTIEQMRWTTYDSHRRPIRTINYAGYYTPRTSVVDLNYDSMSRVKCRSVGTTLSANYSDPCIATQNSNQEWDRITRNYYDELGRLKKSVSGFDVDPIVNSESTFTANGLLKTLKDGDGNVTTYIYDGFNRLVQTTFPDGSTEKFQNFDANGNIRKIIRRNGDIFYYAYDARNRLTVVNAPSGTADLEYTYDLFSRMTSAKET